MEMKLTGWKAVAAGVAIVGFVIFKFNAQTEALQSEGIEEIKQWLLRESARAAIPDMEKALQHSAENAEFLAQMVDDLQEDNIEIHSVTRRGVGERIVARVEVNYKGETLSDGMSTRYLRMKYSMVTGWRVQRETSKWNYYLASF